MTVFKPWTSGVGSDRSANLATTTAQCSVLFGIFNDTGVVFLIVADTNLFQCST